MAITSSHPPASQESSRENGSAFSRRWPSFRPVWHAHTGTEPLVQSSRGPSWHRGALNPRPLGAIEVANLAHFPFFCQATQATESVTDAVLPLDTEELSAVSVSTLRPSSKQATGCGRATCYCTSSVSVWLLPISQSVSVDLSFAARACQVLPRTPHANAPVKPPDSCIQTSRCMPSVGVTRLKGSGVGGVRERE